MTPSLLQLVDGLGTLAPKGTPAMTLASRLAPYEATFGADPDPWDPERRWPHAEPREAFVDLELLAPPVPASHREVLDLIAALPPTGPSVGHLIHPYSKVGETPIFSRVAGRASHPVGGESLGRADRG